jgi:DNA-binding winged helix-turn-helix (wHTH) protein/Tfp pilus assembly protein PilF
LKVRQTYRFGDYLFKPDSNEIRMDGKPIVLEQKVADLLLVFCQHAGEILPKDWLIEQVWPERVVNEDSLSVAISKLRRILSDNRHSPSYIKTLTGKGYQWLADVVAESVQDIQTPPAAVSLTITGRDGGDGAKSVGVSSRVLFVTLTLLLLVLLPIGWFAYTPEPVARTTLPAELTELAVQAEELLQSGQAKEQRQAIELYRQIQQRAPDYLDAYLGIAQAKLQLSALQSYLDLELYVEEVRALLSHVLETDPENARAWGLRATMYFLVDWDFDKADMAFKKAIEYAPEDPRNYLPYSEFLLTRGQFQEAEAYLNQLRAINPSYYRYLNMSFVYMMRNEPELALAEIRRLQKSEAQASSHNRMLHRLGILLKDENLAFSELKTLFKQRQVPQTEIEKYQQQFQQHGLKGVFALMLEQRFELNVGHYLPPLAWARYAVVAGQPQQAVKWLTQAIEQRQSAVLLVPVDPHYHPLRNQPEFKALLSRLPR